MRQEPSNQQGADERSPRQVEEILTLAINLAVVADLRISHRLFGIRGADQADEAEPNRDTGWERLSRVTP